MRVFVMLIKYHAPSSHCTNTGSRLGLGARISTETMSQKLIDNMPSLCWDFEVQQDSQESGEIARSTLELIVLRTE